MKKTKNIDWRNNHRVRKIKSQIFIFFRITKLKNFTKETLLSKHEAIKKVHMLCVEKGLESL